MNKKEKFMIRMKDLYGLELQYDKSDSFNRHRNTIYTEIPDANKTYALSSIANDEEVRNVEQHIGNKVWIHLK